MRLRDLFPSYSGAANPEVNALTVDSRTVKPGAVFAALPGTKMDGRDFIPQAIAKGASAVLSLSGLPELSVPTIQSDEPRQTYARAAARFYPKQPTTIAAMTGTNGKSSTVEFLRQLWAFDGKASACFGTLGVISPAGYRALTHTTPDAMALHHTLQGLSDEGVTHAGMEASSHGLKQYRLDGVRLSAVGFSNLTQDHFDYHPDMDDYFKAKARLFTELAPGGVPAVITVDGSHGARMFDLAKARGLDVMSVGWSGRDLRIDQVMPRASGQALELIYRGRRIKVELPLAGEFQVFNAVTAAGLALKTGVAPEQVFAGLEALYGVAGRMERAGMTPDGAPVFIDFAHTEDGLEKLLRGVRPHTKNKIVVVFGCGGDRDPDKRPKMGAVAARLADDVIVTDDNPRTENAASVRKAVMAGAPKATEIGDRREAIAEGIARLRTGDCLVIAGKGHEQGQIIGTETVPFSDVDVAREILESLS